MATTLPVGWLNALAFAATIPLPASPPPTTVSTVPAAPAAAPFPSSSSPPTSSASSDAAVTIYDHTPTASDVDDEDGDDGSITPRAGSQARFSSPIDDAGPVFSPIVLDAGPPFQASTIPSSTLDLMYPSTAAAAEAFILPTISSQRNAALEEKLAELGLPFALTTFHIDEELHHISSKVRRLRFSPEGVLCPSTIDDNGAVVHRYWEVPGIVLREVDLELFLLALHGRQSTHIDTVACYLRSFAPQRWVNGIPPPRGAVKLSKAERREREERDERKWELEWFLNGTRAERIGESGTAQRLMKEELAAIDLVEEEEEKRERGRALAGVSERLELVGLGAEGEAAGGESEAVEGGESEEAVGGEVNGESGEVGVEWGEEVDGEGWEDVEEPRTQATRIRTRMMDLFSPRVTRSARFGRA